MVKSWRLQRDVLHVGDLAVAHLRARLPRLPGRYLRAFALPYLRAALRGADILLPRCHACLRSSIGSGGRGRNGDNKQYGALRHAHITRHSVLYSGNFISALRTHSYRVAA